MAMLVPHIRASGVVMERLTNAIAAIGVATWFTPEFYEWSVSVSGGFALLMPPLGCVWLAVQIWSKAVKGK
jgi:hypothetical protein